MRLALRALAAASCCVLLLACSSTSDNVDVGGDDGGSTPNTPPPNPPPPVDGGQDAGPMCGRLTTLCPSGAHCDGAPDCQSEVCRMNVCQDASMADGVKNGDETDVDCGGMHAPACADGKMCLVAEDCTSGVCTGGICQVPNDHDGVKNGDETGVDCGGSATNKCAPGQGCNTTADCAQVKCDTVNHVCLSASHSDGIKNDGETGVDCGGATGAARCDVGGGCLADSDCNNVKCDVGATNVCLPPSHTDGLKNGDETGVDCGGPTAPNRCPTGQGCVATSDCDNVKCDVGVTNLCLPPSHSDGIKNDGETGIDCGGAALPTKCPTGQGCGSDADCNNVRCNMITLVCDPPTSTDGLKNGTETDVDCGGGAPTNAPRCDAGKSCVADADCKVICNYANVCVEGPSCRIHNGGDTCGAGEIGQAGAKHESCCASINLLGSTTRIDKYEITAGRVRQFLAVVGNDVQTWWNNFAAANPGNAAVAQIRSQDVQYLPTGLSTPVVHNFTYTYWNGSVVATTTGDHTFGVYDHLGNTVFFVDRPSTEQGCWVGSGANQIGHPTYWWDAATQNAQWGAASRAFSQSDLDIKTLNCTTQILLAAFCAWDGGRLPTQAELSGASASSAWGAATYPWGSSPSSGGTMTTGDPGRKAYSYSSTNFLVAMSNDDGTTNFASALYNTTNWNPFYPSITEARYTFPAVAPANWAQNDEAWAISAPGRFPNDIRPNPNPGAPGGALDGWFDVAANIMEAVADGSGTDDTNHDSLPKKYWVGGSWEGHGINRNGFNFNILTQYGKMGGRCAR